MPNARVLQPKSRRPFIHLLAPFFTWRWTRRAEIDPTRLRRVLIVRPQKIGDVIATLPTVDALRAALPDVKIDFLSSRRSAVVIDRDPRFDRVIVYRKERAFLREALALRRRNHDCVLDMVDGDSTTALVLSQLCASRKSMRIGCVKNGHAPYYDRVTSPPDRSDSHTIERGLELLTLIGIDTRSAERYAPPHLEPENHARSLDFLRETGSGSHGIRIAVALSAGKPSRLWPVEKCRAHVAGLLAELPGAQVILITAPGDRRRGKDVLAPFDRAVAHVPPGLSIADVSALLSRMSLLISPDTSLLHIARSFRVPVVGLYPNATWNLDRWYPYGQRDGLVISDDDETIFSISPGDVLAAVKPTLARHGAGSA